MPNYRSFEYSPEPIWMFLSNWETLARRWNQSQVETLNSEESNAIRKQNIEPLDESAWDIQESWIKTPD